LLTGAYDCRQFMTGHEHTVHRFTGSLSVPSGAQEIPVWSGRLAAAVGTWLMQIAVNLVRSHEGSNRLKFWRRVLGAKDLADVGHGTPDEQRSPEDMVLAREQVEAIWTVVARLSERQRTVFLLRFVEEMDLVEIAAVTGMKEGTVKTHLFRAVQAVRANLEAIR
jgi:RNA polymerase sigma-70 factor, ECF subfamily